MTADVPRLPPRPTRSRTGLIIALALLLGLVGGGVVTALLTRESDDRPTVRIGTTEASASYWATFLDVARERDIDVELVNFSDYTQANPALTDGQLELNSFQHLLFLATYNDSTGADLTPIGATYVVPLSIYSEKHDDLEQVPDGGQVAIPNDPTNQARALLVLQDAGLITLKGGGTPFSTPADVTGGRVEVVPVDAAQTVTSLPSLDAAVVNNNFALDAQLDPTSALYEDDPSTAQARPYTNVFAARAEDVDDALLQEVAEIYHDPRVVAAVKEQTKGTAVISDLTPEQLRSELAELQTQVAKQGGER